MLRLVIPIVFIVLFVIWLTYRLLVTRDIKKHLNTVYLGLFFVGIWAFMYGALLWL